MKKIILFATIVCAFAFAKAQNYELTYNDELLGYGDTISLTANGEECEFYFTTFVVASGTTPTIYATERLNNSETLITSICADNWCIANTTSSPSFTPNAFPLEPNVTYTNHIEFYIPEGAANALFKFKIYAQNAPANKYEFYVKVINPSATPVNTVDALPVVKAYPNPTKDRVSFNTESISTEEVVIYNSCGMIVKRVVMTSGSVAVDVSDLPSGIYLYGLPNSNKRGKLVVL